MVAIQKIIRLSALFAVIYLGAALVLHPQEGINAGYDALLLSAKQVIPSLFPYLICSGFIAKSGAGSLFSRYLSPVMRPLFGVSGSSAIAFVLGTSSGYPVGAICVRDLYTSGECSKNEAERMLAFCNNSGPLFIMSVVGCAFLGDAAVGRSLYISHLLAAVLTGIVLKTFGKTSPEPIRLLPKGPSLSIKNPLQIIGEVVDSSVFNILKICGFVVLFSVLVSTLPKSSFSPYIHSFLEITGGIKALSETKIDYSLKLSIISFFTAFSGLSVMLQVGAITQGAGLSLKFYFWGKFIQGVFSFFLTKILISRLPQSTDAFAKSAAWEAFYSPHSALISSIFMLVFGVLVLLLLFGVSFFFLKNRKNSNH